MHNHLSSVLSHLSLAALGLLLLFSCGRGLREEPSSSAADTTRLRVAILPTLDCLPLVQATEDSTFKRLGLEVHLVMYRSQMDAEQALVEGRVEVCASDVFRVKELCSKGIGVNMLFATNRTWQLCAGKKLRATKVKDVSGRMIAGTRLSAVDYFADQIEPRLSTQNGPMLRPQINDVEIRLRMLLNSQIDAAILPLPLSLLATKKGCTMLCETDTMMLGLAGFAVREEAKQDSLRNKQFRLLRQGYDQAALSLASLPQLETSSDVLTLFHLQDATDKIEPAKTFLPSLEPTI